MTFDDEEEENDKFQSPMRTSSLTQRKSITKSESKSIEESPQKRKTISESKTEESHQKRKSLSESKSIEESPQKRKTSQKLKLPVMSQSLKNSADKLSSLTINIKEPFFAEDEIRQIEIWAKKKVGDIVFNSLKDNWEIETSVFADKIVGKSSLLFFIEIEDGTRCGGFVSETIAPVMNNDYQPTHDKRAFLFSFHEDHDPMKFPIREKKAENAFSIYSNRDDILFDFGSIDLIIRKKGIVSSCYQNSNTAYDYYDVKRALLGRTGRSSFFVNQIIVFQMI